jgi:hypothetical protein
MSEKQVHSRLRRLVDWINLTGAADGQRRVVPRPRPERLASAVVRATFQLERGRKRYRQPAIATPA